MTNKNENIDVVVVGGGIVGLSVAWQLLQQLPGKRVVLLEKEAAVAKHQTGHNSGVIHAGVYYTPGSLKSRLCREGVSATIDFCKEHGVPFEQCGKLIVATNALEYERMLALYKRGNENQLDLQLLDRDQLAEAEPNIIGCGAILSPTTGIVNYRAICEKMAQLIQQAGGEVRLSSEVVGLSESSSRIDVSTSGGATIATRYLVTCTGLMADRTVRMLKIRSDFRIVPYRGEYFQLPMEKRDIVRHLIYPVPDPSMPFLGVHLTRMIDGSVTVGPNAVQGWKREGYGRVNLNARDTWELLSYGGFWRISFRNLSRGLREIRNSLWKTGYLREIQKYCPGITLEDLRPYPAGIRAQAVRADGSMVEDFLFAESPRSLHVCSAPSPAATSAIPIGRHICSRVLANRSDLRT